MPAVALTAVGALSDPTAPAPAPLPLAFQYASAVPAITKMASTSTSAELLPPLSARSLMSARSP